MRKKKIVVLGAGESGIGASLLANKYGLDVFLSEKKYIKTEDKKLLINNNINFEEGMHTLNKVIDAEEIIKSPGISSDSEFMKNIYSSRIPIISEITFALRYTNANIIAITGTNGKTTTSNLIYNILKSCNFNVGIAGNIGKSLSRNIYENNLFTYYILEVSSFQLDDSHEFNPYISILLNITQDHLDRYKYNFKNYIKSKFKISDKQDANHYFIYNRDDYYIMNNIIEKNNIKSKCIPFSINKGKFYTQCYIQSSNIVVENNGKKILEIDKKNFNINGIHDIYNIMPALLSIYILNINENLLKKILPIHKKIKHCLEYFLIYKGIKFIDDSKSTNVDSALYGLKSINTPIIWIVGGKDKGNDYNRIIDIVKKKVKAIICLGKDNKKIIYSFSKIVDLIINTDNMKEAVYSAIILARKGDNILLSPACSSLDLFKNYKERGKSFKNEVKNFIYENSK